LYTAIHRLPRDSENQNPFALRRAQTRRRIIAREVLWFFGALVFALPAGVLLASLPAPRGWTWMGPYAAYGLSLGCFVSIYVARLVNWCLRALR
jgi:dolichyl-phosphate-mannose--protein O-mannosyl transferase